MGSSVACDRHDFGWCAERRSSSGVPSTLEETARPTGDNTRHAHAVKHQPRQYCLIIFVRRQNFGLSFAIHRLRDALCQNVSLK